MDIYGNVLIFAIMIGLTVLVLNFTFDLYWYVMELRTIRVHIRKSRYGSVSLRPNINMFNSAWYSFILGFSAFSVIASLGLILIIPILIFTTFVFTFRVIKYIILFIKNIHGGKYK